MTSPIHQGIRLMNGFRIYQMVVAACRLELPDLLADGPKSGDELASLTGTHSPSLGRYMRAMSVWGFFTRQEDGRYASTQLSDVFRKDRAGLRSLTLMLSEEGYTAWSELGHTLRTGDPAFDRVFGKNRWEKLAEDPDAAGRFNAAMVETTSRVGRDFVTAYDFGGVRTIVDVGGGTGRLLSMVLVHQPYATGVLFDLPAGLSGAAEELAAAGLGERVQLVEGSFLESVPSGGDLYLLKSIIHDWQPAQAQAILDNCRNAMRPGAKLVLIERFLSDEFSEPDEVLGSVMSDLQMMVVFGGRERTPAEYERLMAASGLRMTRVVRLGEAFAAYEAVLSQGPA